MIVRPARGAAYADPYLSGVGIGLVLLASFVLFGHGLGASGALVAVVAAAVDAVAPGHAQATPLFAAQRGPWWQQWLVVELFGVFVGAALSARWAGRSFRGPDPREPLGAGRRRKEALIGGAAMGVGAVLAHGCTSGQALSGGAVTSLGSWVFLLVAFVSAHLTAIAWRSVGRAER